MTLRSSAIPAELLDLGGAHVMPETPTIEGFEEDLQTAGVIGIGPNSEGGGNLGGQDDRARHGASLTPTGYRNPTARVDNRRRLSAALRADQSLRTTSSRSLR